MGLRCHRIAQFLKMDRLGERISAQNVVGSIGRDLARASMGDSVAMRITGFIANTPSTGCVEIPTMERWVKSNSNNR